MCVTRIGIWIFLLAAPLAAFRPEPGDHAEYDIYLFGARIGRQTIDVTARTQTEQGEAYRVCAVTQTERFAGRVYKLRDVVTTTVLYSRHRPVASHIEIREGGHTNTVWVECTLSPRKMHYRSSRGKDVTRRYQKTLVDAVSMIFYFAGKRPDTGWLYDIQVIEGDKVKGRKVSYSGRSSVGPRKKSRPAVLFEEIGGREIKVWYPPEATPGGYFPYRMVLAKLKFRGYPITEMRAELITP